MMQCTYVCMYIPTYDTIYHAMYLEIAFEDCPWQPLMVTSRKPSPGFNY